MCHAYVFFADNEEESKRELVCNQRIMYIYIYFF
jgi:hypothetical protein